MRRKIFEDDNYRKERERETRNIFMQKSLRPGGSSEVGLQEEKGKEKATKRFGKKFGRKSNKKKNKNRGIENIE